MGCHIFLVPRLIRMSLFDTSGHLTNRDLPIGIAVHRSVPLRNLHKKIDWCATVVLLHQTMRAEANPNTQKHHHSGVIELYQAKKWERIKYLRYRIVKHDDSLDELAVAKELPSHETALHPSKRQRQQPPTRTGLTAAAGAAGHVTGRVNLAKSGPGRRSLRAARRRLTRRATGPAGPGPASGLMDSELMARAPGDSSRGSANYHDS